MIVKNESKIIRRLMESVAPWIDDYVICDTGSTDDTPQIIKEFFDAQHIQGTVFHEPFINFEHNRNVALARAAQVSSSKYLLLLDADMQLLVEQFDPAALTLDYYQLVQGTYMFRYRNTRIVRNNGAFRYRGVTHEYIDVPQGATAGAFDSEDVFVFDVGDGGSKGNKVQRDIQLLEEGIAREPGNARYHFYLANTYMDDNQPEKAIPAYLRRIQLGGWQEELFMSYYHLGSCYSKLGQEHAAVVAWMNAYQTHPRRLESLYKLTQYYRTRGKYHLAALYYNQAERTPVDKPEQFLFAELGVYLYRFDVERLICAYYLGLPADPKWFINVLSHGSESEAKNALSNAKFYKYIPAGETKCLDAAHGAMTSSSLSFVRAGSGYICNQRFVNYFITERGAYEDKTQPDRVLRQIITQNATVWLLDTFEVGRREFLEPADLTSYYVGIEDVKLFRHGGDIHFLGTQYCPEKQRLGMATGVYPGPARALTPAWDPDFACEKNWVFVELGGALKMIYKWYPLWVLNMQGERELEIETPAFLRFARGSTCGAKWGNEWFFVVHFVSEEAPRHYYHMVLVLSEELHVLRWSRLFSFEGAPIEFCLGLAVEETSCVFGYSAWDRSSRIKRIQKNDLFF